MHHESYDLKHRFERRAGNERVRPVHEQRSTACRMRSAIAAIVDLYDWLQSTMYTSFIGGLSPQGKLKRSGLRL